ncbi:MAG TPA: ROK family transcriptional regulator [Beutenbergiaceae bacterium]|nr:ROK family transcriptional regulator [Beutenbergiaceae bacterium]
MPAEQPHSGDPHGSNSVRQANLAKILHFVHHRGPLSRADLTRATGLNRSTVGALLRALSDRGLVVMGEPARDQGVGRPSPLTHPAPDLLAVTVYPDADAVEVAAVGLGGRVIERIRRTVAAAPTPEDTVALTISTLEQDLQHRLRDATVLGIGVAVPGLVRSTDGFVHMAPHLPWRNVPIAELMAAGTGLATVVGNDAAVGADAEGIFGVGKGGARPLVYLHGGFGGIGSGLQLTATGFPPEAEGLEAASYLPELGHVLVNSAGRPCHCGASGCLETEVSFERLRAAMADLIPEPAELEPADLPVPMEHLEGPALKEVERQLEFLAVGIRNAVNAFAPELIVFGGFLGPLLELGGQAFLSRVRAQLMPPLASVQLRRANMGARRIHVGAAEQVFRPLLHNPLAAPAALAAPGALAGSGTEAG